jgi:hydrophobic/amphiphilic exporter-1 (mainly G- bacteria), HAE1 family
VNQESQKTDMVMDVPTNAAVQFSVQRYVLTIGAFVAVVLFGLIATIGLPINLQPKLDIPVVAISTSLPGSTPESIERTITKPIEDAVSSLPGVVDLTSSSASGFSSVIVTFAGNVNIDSATNDINGRVSSIRDGFPSAAKAPVVSKFDFNSQPILSVSIVSSGADARDVVSWANKVLKQNLERVPGVASVRISGAAEREIQVRLSKDKLAALNLNAAQVVQAIQSNAPDLPAGTVNDAGKQINFTTKGLLTSLNDVEQILVDPARGVRVVDIATVRDTNETLVSYARVNGQPVVLATVFKTSNANTVSATRGVRQAVAQLEKPKGYDLILTGDGSRYVEASVLDTAKEGIIVALAVAVICLIALGKLNTAFAVVLAIPISLAAAPILFQLMGFSFNTVSLLALIVAMGIVVDDSIVVAENVDRYRKMGYNALDSVLKGTSEIFSAASAATFSLMAVLLPISFIPGLIGQYFREFGLGLAAAIFFSWLEALFFLTVRMAYTPDSAPVLWKTVWLEIRTPKRSLSWAWKFGRSIIGVLALLGFAAGLFSSFGAIGLIAVLVFPVLLILGHYVLTILFASLGALTASLHAGSEHLLGSMAKGYAKSLDKVLNKSVWVLAGAAIFLLSAGVVFTLLPFNFTPKQDQGRASISLKLPAGTSLETMNDMAARVEQWAAKQHEIKTSTASIGLFGEAGNVESWRSSFDIELIERAERSDVWTLTERWRTDLKASFADRPEIETSVSSGDGGAGVGDLQLNLNATNQDLLLERIPKVISALRSNQWVRDASSTQGEPIAERAFIPDRSALKGTGLTPEDLANTLRTASVGEIAGNLRDNTAKGNGENVKIRVALEQVATRNEQSLLELPVTAPNLNTNLPLGELGHFELRQSPSTINRSNKVYTSVLNIFLKPNNPGSLGVQTELETQLKTQNVLDDRVKLAPAGSFSEAKLVQELVVSGGIALGLAVLLNYLVLGSQFNSFRYPLYLLMPVPLALVGALWTLFLFGAGLDIFTLLGMVILTGLSTKNAILLLDFVVERAKQLPLKQALIESGSLRLRPIIMTTLTVLVISFPLIFGGGEGAELRKGIGIAILGGVISSTFLTLFVVPAAFYLFERHRLEKREPEKPSLEQREPEKSSAKTPEAVGQYSI